MFEHLCNVNRDCDPEVMQSVIRLAVEMAREGREGRRVGAILMVGDEDRVLARSRPMILDPLQGHAKSKLNIRDPNLRETLKELSLLDGAFVISGDGYAVAACRYLDADAWGLNLPLGLGSRHVAAAAMTRATRAMAVVVSESAVVRIFFEGELLAEVVPDIWLLGREMRHLRGPVEEHEHPGVKIFTLQRDRSDKKEADHV
jgi:DNA integrity scanning protein DisA with diadenylate cyclase activity